MSVTRSFLYAASIVAFQTLAGCGGNGPSLAPQTPRLSFSADAAPGALLYVSDPGTNVVSMYSYPELRLRGKLFGLKHPTGLCVDPSTGNVWIVSGKFVSSVSEFPHGGTTPIRILKIRGDPAADACAVDPTTGNLAVVESYNYDDPGSVLIFKNGSGKPTYYPGPLFDLNFVGYDNAGDAYVNGPPYGRVDLEELKTGAKRAENATPKHFRSHSPGGVQYDGSYMAVGVANRAVIYQTLDRAIVGTTKLSQACDVHQFFIDGAVVIAPNVCHSTGDVLLYNYPAGGSPIKRLAGFKAPYAVVISR